MGGVRTRRSSYGDGLSMPDADDDELGPLASDSPLRHGRTLAGSLWWTISSVALVAALMSASMPLWLQLVAAAEAYASLRRAVIWWVSGDAADGPPKGHVSTERRPAAPEPPGPGRLRHFVSFRFKPTAPADEIVARFLGLDALPMVRTIDFGTNCSPEGKARGHTHGFLITFDDIAARDAYLTDPEHVAFGEYAGSYIEDVYVFDFIS